MKLLKSSFKKEDGLCHLSLFPVPSKFLLNDKERVISNQFSKSKKSFKADMHPMQLSVYSNGIVQGELDVKEFGLKIDGFGNEIDNITKIDYNKMSFKLTKDKCGVIFENKNYDIEYRLNGLSLKQTVKIKNKDYILPICENIYIHKDSVKTIKSNRIEVEEFGALTEYTYSDISLFEDNINVGQFSPGIVYNKDNTARLQYKLIKKKQEVYIVTDMPEEVKNWELPIFIDPNTNFGWTKNLGICRRTSLGGGNFTYVDYQHPSIAGAGAGVEDVESPNYWTGSSSPLIDSNGIMYADLFIPNKYKNVIKEISKVAVTIRTFSSSGATGVVNASILPTRIRPLNGSQTTGSFTPDFTMQRIGMLPNILFDFVNRFQTISSNKAYEFQTLSQSGADYSGTIFDKNLIIGGRTSEVFNDFVNSDRESRFTLVVYTTLTKAITIATTPVTGAPVEFVLTWLANTDANQNITSNNVFMPPFEPSISFVEDPSEIGSIRTSLGASTRDFNSTNNLTTPDKFDAQRMDERSNIKDEYLYFDNYKNGFNYFPNPYFLRADDSIVKSGISIARETNIAPNYQSKLDKINTIKITCNSNVITNQSNISNITVNQNRHFVLIPLHNMEFMKKYVAQFWVKADNNLGGSGWNALVIHGFDYTTNKWMSTKLEKNSTSIGSSTSWTQYSNVFKPYYSAAWQHSRISAEKLNTDPECKDIRTWNAAQTTLFGKRYSPYSCFILLYSNNLATTGSIYLNNPSVMLLNNSNETTFPFEGSMDEINCELDSDTYNSILESKNRILQIPFRAATISGCIEPRKGSVISYDRSPGLDSLNANILSLPYIPESGRYVYFNPTTNGSLYYNLNEEPLDEGSIEFYYCPAFQVWQRGSKVVVPTNRYSKDGSMIYDSQNSLMGGNSFEVNNGSVDYLFDNSPRHIFSLGNLAVSPSGTAFDTEVNAGAGMGMFRIGNSLVWQIREPGHMWAFGSPNSFNNEFGMTNNMAGNLSKDKAIWSCQFNIPESMINGSTNSYFSASGRADTASWMHVKLVWGPRMEMYINGNVVDINSHAGFVNSAPMSQRSVDNTSYLKYSNFRTGKLNKLFFGNYALSYKNSEVEVPGNEDLRFSLYNSNRNFNYVAQSDDCIIQEFGISKKTNGSVFGIGRKDFSDEVGLYNNTEFVSNGMVTKIGGSISPYADISGVQITRIPSGNYVDYIIQTPDIDSFGPGGFKTLCATTSNNTKLYLKGYRYDSSNTPSCYKFTAYYSDVNWNPTSPILPADNEIASVSGINIFSPFTKVNYAGYIPNDKLIWCGRYDGDQAYINNIISRVSASGSAYSNIGGAETYTVQGIDSSHAIIKSTVTSNIFVNYSDNQFNGYNFSLSSLGTGARIIRDWKKLANGHIIVTFDSSGSIIPNTPNASIFVQLLNWNCQINLVSNSLFGIKFNKNTNTSEYIENTQLSVYSESLLDRGLIPESVNQGEGYHCNDKLILSSPYPEPATTTLNTKNNPYIAKVWFDGYWHITISGSDSYNDFALRIRKYPFTSPTSSDITIIEDRNNRFSIDGSGNWDLKPGSHLIFKTAPGFSFVLTRVWYGGTGSTDPFVVFYDGKQHTMPSGDGFITRLTFKTPMSIVKCADSKSSLCFESEFNNQVSYRSYDIPLGNKWIIEGKSKDIDYGANVSMQSNMEHGDFGVVITSATDPLIITDYYASRNVTDGSTTESYAMKPAGGIYLAFHVSEQYTGTKLAGGHLFPNLFPLYSVIHSLVDNPLNGTWTSTEPDLGANVVIRNSNRWCRFPFHYKVTKTLYGFSEDGTVYSDINKLRYLVFTGTARGGAISTTTQLGLLRTKLRISGAKYTHSDLSAAQKQTIETCYRTSSVGEPITMREFGIYSKILDVSRGENNTYGSPIYGNSPQLWFDGYYWNLKQNGSNLNAYSSKIAFTPIGRGYPMLGGFLCKSIYGFEWDMINSFAASGVAKDIASFKVVGEGFDFAGNTERHPTCRLGINDSYTNIFGAGFSSTFNTAKMLMSSSSGVPAAIGGAAYIQTSYNNLNRGTYFTYDLNPYLSDGSRNDPWQNLIGHIKFNIASSGVARIPGIGLYQPHVVGSNPMAGENIFGNFADDKIIIGRDGYFKDIDYATGSLYHSPSPNAIVSPNPSFVDDPDNRLYFTDILQSSNRHVRILQPQSYKIKLDIENDIYPKDGRSFDLFGFAFSGRKHMSLIANEPVWKIKPEIESREDFGLDETGSSFKSNTTSQKYRKIDEECGSKFISQYSGSFSSPVFSKSRPVGESQSVYYISDGGNHMSKIKTEASSIVLASQLRVKSDIGAPLPYYDKVCLGQTRDVEVVFSNIGNTTKTFAAGQACFVWRNPTDSSIISYATNPSGVTLLAGEQSAITFPSFVFMSGVYSNIDIEGGIKAELQYPTTVPIASPTENYILNDKMTIQRNPRTNIGLYNSLIPSDKVFYINGDVYNAITNEDDIRTTVNGRFYSYFSRSASNYIGLSDLNFIEQAPGEMTRVQKNITKNHPNPRFTMRIAYKDKTFINSSSISRIASIDYINPISLDCQLQTFGGTNNRVYSLIDFVPTTTDDSSNSSPVVSLQTFSNLHKYARVTAKGLRDGATRHDGKDFKLILSGYVNGKYESIIECIETIYLVSMNLQDAPSLSLNDWKLKSPQDQDGSFTNTDIIIPKNTSGVEFDVKLSCSGVPMLRPFGQFVTYDNSKTTVNEYDNANYSSEYTTPPSVITTNLSTFHTGNINLYSSWTSGVFIHTFNGKYEDINNEGSKNWYYKIVDHQSGANSIYNRDSNGCPFSPNNITEAARKFTSAEKRLNIFGPPVVSGAIATQDLVNSGLIKLEFDISTPGFNTNTDLLFAARSVDGLNHDRFWIDSGEANLNASGYKTLPVYDNIPLFGPILYAGDLKILQPIAANNMGDSDYLKGNFDNTSSDPRHMMIATSSVPAKVRLYLNAKHRFRHQYNSLNTLDGFGYENNPVALGEDWTVFIRSRRHDPSGVIYLYNETPVNFKYYFKDPINLSVSGLAQTYSSPIVGISGFNATAFGTGNNIDSKQYSLDAKNWNTLAGNITIPSGNTGWNSIYFRAQDKYHNIAVKSYPRPYDLDTPTQSGMIAIPQYNDFSTYDLTSGNSDIYVQFPNFNEGSPFKWELEYKISNTISGKNDWSTYRNNNYVNTIPLHKKVVKPSYSSVWETFNDDLHGWNAERFGGSYLTYNLELNNDFAYGVDGYKCFKASSNASGIFIKNTTFDVITKPMIIDQEEMKYFYLTMKIENTLLNKAYIIWKNEDVDTTYSKEVSVYPDSMWHTYNFDMSTDNNWLTQRKTLVGIFFDVNNNDLNSFAQNTDYNIYLAHFGFSSKNGAINSLVPIGISGSFTGSDYIEFASVLTDWAGRQNRVADSNLYYFIPVKPDGINIKHKKSNDGKLKAQVNYITTNETGSSVEYRIRYRKSTSSIYEYMDSNNWHTKSDWESGSYTTQELEEGITYIFSVQARNPNSTNRITDFSAEYQFFSDYITPQVIWTSHFSDIHWLYQEDKNIFPVPNITSAPDTAIGQGNWQKTKAWKIDEYGQYFKADWNHNFYHYDGVFLSNSTDHNFQCNMRNIIGGFSQINTTMPTHPVDGFYYKITYGESSRDGVIVSTSDSFIDPTFDINRNIGTILATLDPYNGGVNPNYNRNICYIHIRPYYKIVNTRYLFDKKYQVHISLYLDYNDNKHPVSSLINSSRADGLSINWNSNLLPSGLNSEIYTISANVKPSIGIKVINERPQHIKYELLSRLDSSSPIISGVYSNYYLAAASPDDIVCANLSEHTKYELNYLPYSSAGILGSGLPEWGNKTWTNIRPAETIISIYPSGEKTYFEFYGLENENIQPTLIYDYSFDKNTGNNFFNTNVGIIQTPYNGGALFNGVDSRLELYSSMFSNLDNYSLSFRFKLFPETRDGSVFISEYSEIDDSLFSITLSSGKFRLLLNDKNNDNIFDETVNTLVNDNLFHHFVLNDNNGDISIYIDGTLVKTISYVKSNYKATKTEIGSFNNQNFMKMILDEYKIYNNILSEEIINDSFNRVVKNGYYEIWDWMNGKQIGVLPFAGEDIYKYETDLTGGVQSGYIVKSFNNDHITFDDYAENKEWSLKPVSRFGENWKPKIYDYLTIPKADRPNVQTSFDYGLNKKSFKVFPQRNQNQDQKNINIHYRWNTNTYPATIDRIIASGVNAIDSDKKHNLTEYVCEVYENDNRLGFTNWSGVVLNDYNSSLWKTYNDIVLDKHYALSSGINPNNKYGFRIKARNNNIVTDNYNDSSYIYSDWSDINYSNINKTDEDYDNMLHLYVKNAGPSGDFQEWKIYETVSVVQEINKNFESLKDFRITFKIAGEQSTDLDDYPSYVSDWVNSDPGDLFYPPESISRLVFEAFVNNNGRIERITRNTDLWNSNNKNGKNTNNWGIMDNNNISIHDDYGIVKFDQVSENYGNISEQKKDTWYHLKWNIYDDILNGEDQVNSNGSLESKSLFWTDVVGIRMSIINIAFYASGIYSPVDSINTWRQDKDLAKKLETCSCGTYIRNCSIGWSEERDYHGFKVNNDDSWNGDYLWRIQPKNIKVNPDYTRFINEKDSNIYTKQPKQFIEKLGIDQPNSNYYYNSYVAKVMEE